jgi:hypothetical protein
MLTNEVLAIDKMHELAFIPQGRDSRKRSEDSIANVDPNRVSYGFRVNGLRYNLHTINNRSVTADPDDFRTTEERTYGFLIKTINTQGLEVYTVIKPTNIIAKKTDYRKHWDAYEEQQRIEHEAQLERNRIHQEKMEQRREIQTARSVPMQAEAERTKETLNESIKIVLGQKAWMDSQVSVRVDGAWNNLDTPDEEYVSYLTGSVSLTIKDFQRLLEKALAE